MTRPEEIENAETVTGRIDAKPPGYAAEGYGFRHPLEVSLLLTNKGWQNFTRGLAMVGAFMNLEFVAKLSPVACHYPYSIVPVDIQAAWCKSLARVARMWVESITDKNPEATGYGKEWP